jgi:hypothetical protein
MRRLGQRIGLRRDGIGGACQSLPLPYCGEAARFMVALKLDRERTS